MLPPPPPPPKKKRPEKTDLAELKRGAETIRRTKIKLARGFDRFDLIAFHIAARSPANEDLRLSCRRFIAACNFEGVEEITEAIAEAIYSKYPQLTQPLCPSTPK